MSSSRPRPVTFCVRYRACDDCFCLSVATLADSIGMPSIAMPFSDSANISKTKQANQGRLQSGGHWPPFIVASVWVLPLQSPPCICATEWPRSGAHSMCHPAPSAVTVHGPGVCFVPFFIPLFVWLRPVHQPDWQRQPVISGVAQAKHASLLHSPYRHADFANSPPCRCASSIRRHAISK